MAELEGQILKGKRSRTRQTNPTSQPFEGAVRVVGPTWTDNWQPTFPILSGAEAVRYAMYQVHQLGLGKAVPNVEWGDYVNGKEFSEEKYVKFDKNRGEYSFELVILPEIKVGRFSVSREGFIGRKCAED